MIVGIFGPPGGFAGTGVEIIQTILTPANDSCTIMRAETAEQFRTAAAGGSKSILIVSECPDCSLVEEIVAQRLPAFLFTMTFAATVDAFRDHRDLSLREAVCATTRFFSAVASLPGRDRISIVRKASRTSLAEFVAVVIRQLDLSPDHVDLQHLAAHLHASGKTEAGVCLDDLCGTDPPRANSEADEETIAALTPLFASFDVFQRGANVDAVRWPAAAFCAGDQEEGQPTGLLDLTGPARCLIYGPYFALPQGRWIARPRFEAIGLVGGNELLIDVVAEGEGAALAAGSLTLSSPGRFSCALPFAVDSPRLPIEIRFSLTQGAIDGQFRLEEVRLDRC